MDRYEELARQATWVASKVSSDVHGVDTMVGHLAEGRFKIGAGDTAESWRSLHVRLRAWPLSAKVPFQCTVTYTRAEPATRRDGRLDLGQMVVQQAHHGPPAARRHQEGHQGQTLH